MPRASANRDEDYILVQLYPGERERLTAIAEQNERSVSAEIRWQLRGLLRPPGLVPTPAEDTPGPATAA